MAYIGRDIEYGVLEKQTLTADSSTVAFDLTYISNANGLIVSVGGVVQEPNVAYTVLGSTLTFTAAPTTGDTVYVVYLGQEMTVSEVAPTDYMDYQVGTGDGSDTTPITTLNHSVSLAQDIMVTLNGIRQVPSTDYGVSGTTLTFTTAPADGVAILVYFLVLVRANGTVVDNSVTDAKIVGMSGSKITTGTVPAGAVSNASIIGMDAAKLTGTLPESMGADLSLSYQRLATLGLHVQNLNNKVAFNLTDSFLDSFEDSTGVDSVNSVNALVSSDEYVTSASEADNATNIAPSSNDWDYSFDGGNEWPVAGNSLGDHTIGGYIDNIGGDSAISSLITFDGDFDIEWTATGLSASAFGVHALTDDDHRTTGQYLGAKAMTNSFSWIHGGTNPKDFFIGSTAQSDTNDFADGSVIKIERRSGTIKVYDDGSEVHSFSTTYTGAMRFWLGSGGQPFAQNYDNIKFTDTEKVQRDGFFNETDGTSRGWGGSLAERYYGFAWKPTRSGTIVDVKGELITHTSNFDSNCTLYSHDGTSPSSLLGTSDTLALSSAGTKTWTFTTQPAVEKGTWYWLVFSDLDGGGGNTNWRTIGNYGSLYKSGKAGAIASIVDGTLGDLHLEVAIDTSVGEPTPDHDTLLLIQSDTTNGSQTFVDSSQTVASITVGGNTQHDTSQNLGFGTSSILFDGTGDYLSFPNSYPFNDLDANTNGDFTVDATIRIANFGSSEVILALGNAAAWSTTTFTFGVASSNKLYGAISNNGSPGLDLLGSTTLSADTDYHVALVKMGSSIKMYLNGVVDYSTTNGLTLKDSTYPLTIGTDARLTTSWFDGWIKEVRFSSVARWDADFTPPTSAYGTATNTTLSATGSLVSTASTADSTVSEVTGAILVKNDEGTATLGTDLKAYFSANNGSNWTEAASYGSPTTFDGTTNVIPLGKTTLSNTGTAVKMKAEWANQIVGVPAGTAKTITAVGDTQHSTTQNKIGASSIYCDGTGDLISVTDSDDFAFSGDYTVEFWVYFVGAPANNAHICGQGGANASNYAFMCRSEGSGNFIFGSSNGTNQKVITAGVNIASQWAHVAMVKSGTSQKLYVNGTQAGPELTHSEPVQNVSAPWEFGGNSSQSSYIEAYFDEIRFSDSARYTANFTPSTTAFTRDDNTLLLIHSDTTNASTTFTDSSPVVAVAGKQTQLHGWAVNY